MTRRYQPVNGELDEALEAATGLTHAALHLPEPAARVTPETAQ